MYTPSRLHKKISIYTIMDPTTETNATEVVPVAVPETVVEPAETQEPVVEAAPEPAAEAAPEPVVEPVPEPAAEAAPEPAAEAAPEPVVEPVPEPAAEAVPEPAAEAAPEPVVEPVPEPAAEAVPEPVAEPVPEPAAEAASEPVVEPVPETVAESQDADPENILDMSDYTTPEYLELVKKLIEKPEEETKEISKKAFKIPGYNSIQLINTSKQPRRKSMTFV